MRGSTKVSCFTRLGWLGGLGLLCVPAVAELKPLTNVEGISEYRLDNGLQVLLFPDSSKPTVTVNITYFVGSRHEGRGETGMAHLLEHMVFKGTPDHPNIWKSLEDHGARFNGTTWTDRTNYFETLPSEVPGNLEWALGMEADRMINSWVRGEDLTTEMTVVRNEFEMGENNPTGILEERMMSTAFLWHNYGKSTIGSRSDIERVPIPNLQAFYKKYYQPDNAMLVVAGNFKPDQVLTLIEKYFAPIPKPERKLEDTYTIEPMQDGARHVELKRNGDVSACGVCYHTSAASHADYAALQIIEEVLGDEPSGRLYKALVESGMATSVNSYAYGWREPGATLAMAQVRLENPVEPVLKKMIEVMEGLGKNEITEEEVARAQRKILKNIELLMKDSGRIGVALSDYASSGDWRLFFLNRDRIEQIKPDHVRRVAAHYFTETNRTSGIFYPTKDSVRTEVPETPNVAALVKEYKGKEALAAGEEFDATPDNIESRVKRSELPNGMKVALLSKETRGDSVQATLTLRFGSEGDIKGKQSAIGLIPEMLMRGSKNHTYQQIRDKFDELKANVNMGGGGPMGGTEGTMNVGIRTERKNLPAVLKLVGEILKEPVFPTDEFEVLKKENLAGLEEQLSDPQALAFNSMMRRMSPWPSDDVRYVPTVAESIERLKAVDVEQLRQFHKDQFGANHAQITVVGDFDPAEITKTLDEALGGWKAARPFKRVESKFRGDVTASDDSIETPDKKMAMVGCATNMELRDDDPDYPALHFANYVLGASAKSRLLDRLRQKEGLSYGAGSFIAADSEDKDSFFASFAICAPENTHKAYKSLIDEVEKLVKEGIGPDELADCKKSFALQVKNRLANDGAVAGMLNQGLYLGRTMAFQKDLYKKIDDLTPAQVERALKKQLDISRLVKVKAGDLKAAQPVD